MTDQQTPGKFITVEGVEGVGKSTNIAFISEFLQQRGIDLLLTREPGGTELAEHIRELLLKDRAETVDPIAELLLVFAARAQHLNTVIRPALQRGTWVLCDRFTDATYAYQGAGRKLDTHAIKMLELLVQNGLKPDLTLILDLDPQAGLIRASERGELDRFEKERLDFFQRVRDCYLDIARNEPSRCAVINAALPLEAVRSATLGVVARLVNPQ